MSRSLLFLCLAIITAFLKAAAGFKINIWTDFKIRRTQYMMANYKFHEDSDKFVPSSIEKRILSGTCSPVELDRVFSPSRNERAIIEKRLSKGFTGTIFSLEGVLLNLAPIYEKSFANLASDMNKKISHPERILDSIGSPLHDAFLSIGLHISEDYEDIVEDLFYDIFKKKLSESSISIQPGALDLISELVENGDKISIISSLPHILAMKAISNAGFTSFLEKYIPSSSLICASYPREPIPFTERDTQTERDNSHNKKDATPKDSNKYISSRGRNRESLLLKACGMMRKPTYLSVRGTWVS